MARLHKGGFISEDFYWDIGTPDRGRDGHNARDAAKRYNDHRHPPRALETSADVQTWLTEPTQSSRHPDRTTEIGGILEDDANTPMRQAGDTATHEGLVWVYGPDGKLVPLGVGAGCYIDTDGVFHREVKYDVIQLVGPTEVSALDTTVFMPGGRQIQPLGERVGAYTLDPARYATARCAPFMYVRLTCSLVPTFEASEHPDYAELIQKFPHRASILLMQLTSAEEQEGLYVTSGQPEPLAFYTPEGTINESGAHVLEVTQAGGANISVADSAPLALNLDSRFFLQIFSSVHEYTQAEVDAIDPTADLEAVRACSACVLDILSITLEIEGLLGVSPFIDDGGTRYTRANGDV
jgi:hypothetical protein